MANAPSLLLFHASLLQLHTFLPSFHTSYCSSTPLCCLCAPLLPFYHTSLLLFYTSLPFLHTPLFCCCTPVRHLHSMRRAELILSLSPRFTTRLILFQPQSIRTSLRYFYAVHLVDAHRRATLSLSLTATIIDTQTCHAPQHRRRDSILIAEYSHQHHFAISTPLSPLRQYPHRTHPPSTSH